MVRVYVDKTINKILVQSDDLSVKYLFEVKTRNFGFIPWKRQTGWIEKNYKIYDGKPTTINGVITYTLGLGWAAYIVNVLRNYITEDDYNGVIQTIISDTHRDIPFPELRDYQNEDVLHLLKYRVGLFGCYTSYGKTQTIATLANYAYSLGESVLLVTPGKKAQEELVKRCKMVFGLDVPSKDGRLDCIITQGLTNRKDYKDPVLRQALRDKISKFKWVMSDETEYTINDSGEFIYSSAIGADHFYGFSGTANKATGEMISFVNGLTEDVLENKDLIKYFGPHLVYRMPLDLKIDNIRVKTYSMNQVKFEPEDFGDDQNVYQNIMNRIWTHPEVCKCLVKMCKHFPMCYIPMNNLQNIIGEWIDHYFLGVFRILLICHEGYIYYDLLGNRTKLKDLTEACQYVKDGKVDIIPSTSSGFRALDLPGLENICLLQGKVAGVVLQSVGRTARGAHMNILSMEPKFPSKVPVYTKGAKHRDEMIHNYYKYCEIVDSIINEEQL